MSELKYDAIIIGNTYGRLTAVKRGEDYVSPNGCRFQRHVYKCKCGNEKTIRDIDVQNGRTKSCGCLHKEKSAEVMRKIGKSNKKLNAHMLSENGTYTIIVTSIHGGYRQRPRQQREGGRRVREILFRGRRIDGGEWVYGDLVHIGNNTRIYSEKGAVRYTIDPDTVEQYTGLTDKQGVKVFEGDVLHVEVCCNRQCPRQQQ